MWSNFFMQEEEQRIGARGRGSRGPAMSDAQEGKIKLAFFIAIAGVTLTVLAVGTEFWVEMNTFKQNHSMTCEAAHFGLWKFCYKKLWVDDVDELRATCGPAELPGDFKRISRLIIKNVLVDRRIAQQENLEAKKELTNFIAKGIRFAIPSSGLNMSAKRLLAKIHVDYYAVGKGQKENLTQDSLTKTRRPSKF